MTTRSTRQWADLSGWYKVIVGEETWYSLEKRWVPRKYNSGHYEALEGSNTAEIRLIGSDVNRRRVYGEFTSSAPWKSSFSLSSLTRRTGGPRTSAAAQDTQAGMSDPKDDQTAIPSTEHGTVKNQLAGPPNQGENSESTHHHPQGQSANAQPGDSTPDDRAFINTVASHPPNSTEGSSARDQNQIARAGIDKHLETFAEQPDSAAESATKRAESNVTILQDGKEQVETENRSLKRKLAQLEEEIKSLTQIDRARASGPDLRSGSCDI